MIILYNLETNRPQTARVITIRDLNTKPYNPYYELDTENEEGIFSSSMKKTPNLNHDKNDEKTVEKVLHNLNYFPNKPVLLTTNVVSKEDPSWGISHKSAKELVSQTEDKGHYQHLATFLEDTICQRREPACTAVVPYARPEAGKIFLLNSLEKSQTFRDEGVNTIECSLASSLN